MKNLKSISLKNFRIFRDEASFELSPVTILTGKNNSGKSTVFKSLLLLQDNIFGHQKWQSISFQGKRHKLGTYKFAVNRDSSDQDIEIALELDFPRKRSDMFGSVFPSDYVFSEKVKVIFHLGPSQSEMGIIKNLKIFAENSLIFQISLEGDLNEDENAISSFAHLNFRWFIDKFISFLEDDAIRKASSAKTGMEERPIFSEIAASLMMGNIYNELEAIEDIRSGILNMDTFEKWFHESPPSDPEQVIKDVEAVCLAWISKLSFPEDYEVDYYSGVEISSIQGVAKEYFDILTNHEREEDEDWFGGAYFFGGWIFGEQFQGVPDSVLKGIYEPVLNARIDIILKKSVFRVLNLIKAGILKVLEEVQDLKINYIEAVRATAERLHSRDNQISDFNELLMSIRENPLNDKKIKFINRWLSEFGLAESLRIEGIEGVATKLVLTKDGQEMVLADMGYGVTQVLPILIKIAFLHDPIEKGEKGFGRKLLLIEEPESNLHPDLQSRLADMFLDAVQQFKVQILVETHSEYLIRKFQFLTVKKSIAPDDVSIYYIHATDNIPPGEAQNKRLRILQDGRLDGEFGPGFFDESARLMMSILTGENLN